MLIKVFYGDDKRRVQGDFSDYNALQAKLRDMFGLPQAMPLGLRANGTGAKGQRAAAQVMDQEGWTQVLSTNAALDDEKPVRVWVGTGLPDVADVRSQPGGPLRGLPEESAAVPGNESSPVSKQDQRRALKAAEREIRQLKKQLARRDVIIAKEALNGAVKGRDAARDVVKEARQRLQEARTALQGKTEAVKTARTFLQQTRQEMKDSREEAAAAGIPATDTSSSEESSGGCSAGEEEMPSGEGYILVPPTSSADDAAAVAAPAAEEDASRQKVRARSKPKPKNKRRNGAGKPKALSAADAEALVQAQNEPSMSAGHVIVLRSTASGKTLRVMPNGKVNGLGGTGALARFRVASRVDDRIQLQNARNSELYLGVSPDSYELCPVDKHSACSWFRIVEREDGLVHLRSDVLDKPSGVGINKDGSPRRCDTVGTGPFSQFKVELLSVDKSEEPNSKE